MIQFGPHTKGIIMNNQQIGYLTIKKIQALTGLSYLTIYRKFVKGNIKGAFQFGKQWLISIDDFKTHIDRLKNDRP